MKALSATLGLAGLLALSASCSGVFDLDDGWRRQPGVVEVGGNMTPLELPATMSVGTHTVTVLTFGSGSCTRAAGARVEYDGLTVTIRPFDDVRTRGVCTDDLGPHPRDVDIHFGTAGTWTVRVSGRNLSGAAATWQTTVSVTAQQ